MRGRPHLPRGARLPSRRRVRMLDRIKAFFSALQEGAVPGGSGHDREAFNLAAAALLVHAACVDDSYDALERRRILELVRTRLSLAEDEARALVAAAEARVADTVQILGFTRAVKDNFSYDDRVALIEMLWEVVLADGRLDAHEAQLMRRIGGLIYVSDRDRGLARQRAAARLGGG